MLHFGVEFQSSAVQDELERANKANVRQTGLLEVSEKQVQAAMNQNKDELVTQLNLKLEVKQSDLTFMRASA